MGPNKERSAGQRTFLSLMLIGNALFGVHFENNCNLRPGDFFFLVLVLLPDSTARHLRVVIYYYRSVSLQ